MAGKRRGARPTDPMQIARRRAAERALARDPGRWGIEPATMALPANTGVEIARDLRGRVARAHRKDVFDLMHDRGRLSQTALDAVRRLQLDMAVLHRTHADGGELAPRVDRSRDPQAFSERRLAAGRRIETALTLAGPASARLLRRLCEDDIALGRAAGWRTIVASETGETLADAQGAALRAACENLVGAYAMLDRDAARAGRLSHAANPSAVAAAGAPVS